MEGPLCQMRTVPSTLGTVNEGGAKVGDYNHGLKKKIFRGWYASIHKSSIIYHRTLDLQIKKEDCYSHLRALL